VVHHTERSSTARRRVHSVTTPGLLLGAVALLAFIPACSSSSNPAAAPTTSPSTGASVTSTTSSVTLPVQNSAELAVCAAEAKSLAEALDIYMAEKGAYPSPPAPWSAATYVSNYEPLTGTADGGPLLQAAPETKYDVIEYDSAGHVWVAPPGIYRPYNQGEDFAADPDVCDAAVD
jgi:hypothetical protein